MPRVQRSACLPPSRRLDLISQPIPMSASYGLTGLGRRVLAAVTPPRPDERDDPDNPPSRA